MLRPRIPRLLLVLFEVQEPSVSPLCDDPEPRRGSEFALHLFGSKDSAGEFFPTKGAFPFLGVKGVED